MGGALTLQEYLGLEYTVTQVVDDKGGISFNVKREEFDYTTFTYKNVNPNIIKIIGLTVQTKYSSWRFLKELNG